MVVVLALLKSVRMLFDEVVLFSFNTINKDFVMKKNMTLRAFSLLAVATLMLSWSSVSMADPGRGVADLCYFWSGVTSPAIGVATTPIATYSYNTVTRAAGNSVTRTAVGIYRVTCEGVGGNAPWGSGGHVQVTAYGSDGNYCKVGGWGSGGADVTATVYCFDSAGNRDDSRFNFQFTW